MTCAFSEPYIDWNANLAAIFEAKLKAAIDNRKSKSVQFSNAVFDPKIAPFKPV